MIKITIIRPNGYKMWFNLSQEEYDAWCREILTIGESESIRAVEFNFQKEADQRNLSKT